VVIESEVSLLSRRQPQSANPRPPIGTVRHSVCRGVSYRLFALRPGTRATGRRFRLPALLGKPSTVARRSLSMLRSAACF